MKTAAKRKEFPSGNPALDPENLKPKAEVQVASGPWQVRVYNNYADLEPVWRRMESNGFCTVFQTYDWAACWYETAISHTDAKPLIATVSPEGGDPVWILPLCLYRQKGIKVISFADLGISDYAAPVIAREAPSDRKSIKNMLEAVLGALPPCDLVNFQKISEKVEGRSNPLCFLHNLKRFPADAHGIFMRESWPALAEKIVPPHIRSNIRRRKKLIKKEGETSLDRHVSPDALGPLMDKLIAMRNARFSAIGKPAMPAMWHNFYQSLARRKDRTLDISITTMTVAGETIATSFGILRGKVHYGILTSFEMGRWSRFGPGILLHDAILNRFSEQMEDGYFDFTIGDEVYKKDFGTESHPLYEWMTPRTVTGLFPYIFWRTKLVIRRYPRLLAILKK